MVKDWKYPSASYDVDETRLTRWCLEHNESPYKVRDAVLWLVRNGDRAGAKAYDFVTIVTLGQSSR